MSARDDELLAWAAAAAGTAWTGARIQRTSALRGDLSTRRFWRIAIAGANAPSSAILVDLGPDDLPGYARALKLVDTPPAEPPWLSVHRFLSWLGAPVPQIYGSHVPLRALLVEDVGEVSLVDAVRANPAETADLFRIAVELLLQLHVEGTRALQADLLPAQVAYDQRLFRWEFREFLELGCAVLEGKPNPDSLTAELDAMTAELGRLPRVFSHRDFHGQNLFVQRASAGVRMRVIDFQDALMAPNAQDLAVLLTTRDMDMLISPALERRLLDFYYAGLVRRGAAVMNAGDFHRSYQLCVLQHALKMIGRFLMFERNGKPGYSVFVPHLIEQVRRVLRDGLERDFPLLAAAAGPSSSPVVPE
jgi:aminoglycoside/choline kinase family phosphotransferase